MTRFDHPPPPRRSCLSVPASDHRKLSKAWTSGADELVWDLEDAVAPAHKDEARRAVLAALREAGRHGARIAIRVNAPRTKWCHRDLQELAASPVPPSSIVVPKVESAGDLAFVDRLLDGVRAEAGTNAPIGVQALIESASGVANLREIATATPRLESLILGYADLAASLGRSGATAGEPASWLAIQDAVLVAARTNELQAIDGPYLGVDTGSDFAAAVGHARDLGFDGKWAIHPRQVAAVNEAFSPTEEELDWAAAVLDALSGAGAVALDGQMLDEAVAVRARRLLARKVGARP
ncbi:HpcH/HpaI aldolase/citrate lyase family protein [Planosporangium mesophilum]|uniref:Putative citrate lyase beta chain n=1 Tax=Planosporangium mesophilum TaxID=689768 RepID=A0A8J3X114_9ACTN|nr:CoA ester lyase [Planosporangium mesophilum]NJC86290.1 CoA ester lyase [Planosporangium mesophilum]GII23301.1 putative citrate lyase beta chain [Planosporangium mesophilum]